MIGWREWVALPELGVDWIKAKIDTGARSSSLHAIDLEPFRRRGKSMIRFGVHPVQRDFKRIVATEAEILEYRWVKSSDGRGSERPVILTPIAWNGLSWEIELTLARRDEMGFRMLLGRQAIRGRVLVDSGHSYCGGTPPPRAARKAKAKSKAKSKSKSNRKKPR